MRRPERNFWLYVALLTAVMTLGLSGQLISCASAHPETPDPLMREHTIHRQPQKPWNQPGPAVGSPEAVRMTAQLDRSAVMHRSDGVLRVEVNLDTPQTGGATYQPSDIVVVVDTSGSMQGQKLHYAKQALEELFLRLRAEDRFALVEYNDSSQVKVALQPATARSKNHFRNVAHSLQARGSTNLSGGLDQGISLLRSENGFARPKRILLLSDGLANAGDSSQQGLTRRARQAAASGIALTTMGVGEDFDENVMTSLATSGAGAFYYIAKLNFLPEFFDAELKSAWGTYAHATQLHFHAPPGVTLLDATGLPISRSGPTHLIQVGGLYGARTRTVWLTLRVPTRDLGPQLLGSLSLSYTRNGAPQTVSIGALPDVLCVNDTNLYERKIHRNVWERALLNDVFHRTREEFGDAIRTGDARQLRGAANRAENERQLARRLGSKRVLSKLDELKGDAKSAEIAQRAAPSVRNRAAKAKKARGYQLRNSGAYEDATRAGQAF